MQLCTISGTVWSFLEGVKNSGSPLPRSVIVSRCVRDTALLSSICQVSRSALALLSVDGSNKPKSAVIAGADRILSFLTATVIELADKGSLNDAQLRILYPFLVEGLKKSTEGSEEGKNGNSKIVFHAGGPTDQWRRSSCMIIAQICRKTKLAKPLLKTLVGSLMSAFVSISGVTSGVSSGTTARGVNSILDAAIEVLTIVAIVAQNQKVAMGPKMLMAIFADISASSNSSIESSSDPSDSSIPAARVGSAYILQCLEIMQKEKGFDTISLFKVLTTTLTAALVTNIAEEMKNDPRYLSPMMASKILAYCITSGLLSDSTIGSILWTILQNNSLLGHIGTGLLKAPAPPTSGRRPRAESFSDDNDGDRKEVLRVLRCVSQRYPSIFDSCVQAAYKAVAASGAGGVEALELEAEKMAVVVDEDDDDDDMQVGLSLADINAEKLAKAALLRQLLSDTFTDAPYRMPSDTGVSLMLSLNNTSPLMRVQALETFAVTLPEECESTPDVKGLAQAASLSLTDYDPVVALAAWNAPVVSRIAFHISPQELLECTMSAYNWWTESMSRVPVRAAKVISMILATLSDKAVSKAICSAITPTVNGNVWLFTSIIKCAIDGISSSGAKEEKNDEGVKVAKKARQLQTHALQCAQLLGAGGIQQMFAGISSAALSEGALPHEIIAASVALSLCGEEVGGVIEMLHTASLSFLSKADDLPVERSFASAYIVFLDDVSKHLASYMAAGQVLATYGLQLCTALSVSLISRYIRISDSKGFKMSEGVITAVKNIIARTKSSSISSDLASHDESTSVSDLVSESSRSLGASEIAARLLLTTLESSNSVVAAMAGLCLGQLYGKNTISVLFRVCMCVQRESNVSADDTRLFSPLRSDGTLSGACGTDFSKSCLQVTARMRSSAVAAIAQYVSVLNLGNNGKTLGAAQSTDLTAAAAVAIGACSDESEMLRSAGLLIAKALSALHPSLKLYPSSSSKFSEDGRKVHTVPMTTVELILLGEYLHGSAAVILGDSQAASAILAKKVFAEPAAGTATGTTTGAVTGVVLLPKKGARSQILFDSLLALATLFGWGNSFICIPIMTAASAAPVDSTWKYVKSLLTQQSGGDANCSRLSSAVMRCLATIHEAKELTQGDVVSCFCELITSADETEKYVRNDVLKVLGEGWAMGFSNDNRSELFAALLKEQVITHWHHHHCYYYYCYAGEVSYAHCLAQLLRPISTVDNTDVRLYSTYTTGPAIRLRGHSSGDQEYSYRPRHRCCSHRRWLRSVHRGVQALLPYSCRWKYLTRQYRCPSL